MNEMINEFYKQNQVLIYSNIFLCLNLLINNEIDEYITNFDENILLDSILYQEYREALILPTQYSIYITLANIVAINIIPYNPHYYDARVNLTNVIFFFTKIHVYMINTDLLSIYGKKFDEIIMANTEHPLRILSLIGLSYEIQIVCSLCFILMFVFMLLSAYGAFLCTHLIYHIKYKYKLLEGAELDKIDL
jgi:hypothetical protein